MTAAQDPGPVPVHGALKFHSSAAAAVAARGRQHRRQRDRGRPRQRGTVVVNYRGSPDVERLQRGRVPALRAPPARNPARWHERKARGKCLNPVNSGLVFNMFSRGLLGSCSPARQEGPRCWGWKGRRGSGWRPASRKNHSRARLCCRWPREGLVGVSFCALPYPTAPDGARVAAALVQGARRSASASGGGIRLYPAATGGSERRRAGAGGGGPTDVAVAELGGLSTTAHHGTAYGAAAVAARRFVPRLQAPAAAGAVQETRSFRRGGYLKPPSRRQSSGWRQTSRTPPAPSLWKGFGTTRTAPSHSVSSFARACPIYGANLKSNPNAGANRGWRSRGSQRGGVVALLVRKGGVFGAIVLASIWCQK